MNKFKKLTIAAVSTVMAGTMALSLAACGPKEPDKKPENNTGADKWDILNPDGSLNYDAYKRDSEVTLNLAIGHEKPVTSTSFADIGDQIVLPDGVTYSQGNMKPAWVAMGKDLNISWNDKWTGTKTSDNLEELLTKNDGSSNKTLYSVVDMFTTDLSKAVAKANSGTDILNLADYLDYMPNFRKFLNENPVVYLSLLQEGMDTETGEDQTIYVAPYFDGNDDIERYNLMRHDWAEKLLNGSATTGSTATLGVETKVEPFMTADYTVDSLSKDGKSTIKIKKNYTAALAAAKNDTTPLGTAYKAIAGAAYSGTSGNIVAIMNAAIAANANATGAQLVDLFRAYIDVCYQNEDGTAHFTASDRANLFVGYDACWDVDDLVAMLRCVNTNASALVGAGKTIGGIMPRSGLNDRTPDMVRIAGQLYGVRGTDSRNEYTYIANDGTMKDARASKEIYEACAKLNLLKQEGLIANYSSLDKFTGSGGLVNTENEHAEYFMMYDYSQTQTLNGFYVEDSAVSGGNVPDGYKFGAVINPISKWDVDGDGNHTDVMRFTESWRSTKVSGLALNGALASEANKEKLKAAIQFVDYLYSEDGQIVSTYGPMADAQGNGGFWYNEKATDAEVKANKYFSFKGEKYSGSDYKGRTTPTITSKLYDSFKGKEVNGWRVTSNTNVTKAKLSFTNYARYLIGSTLPVGVKDQSFENQLTSLMGQNGANKVGTALAAGVVKGLSLNIDKDNYWYTCVPTSLPTDTTSQATLDSIEHKNFMYLTGTNKASGKKDFFSIFNWIILYGTDSKYDQQEIVVNYTSIDDLLAKNIGGKLTVQGIAATRQNLYNNAWTTAKSYWTYLSSADNK